MIFKSNKNEIYKFAAFSSMGILFDYDFKDIENVEEKKKDSREYYNNASRFFCASDIW